MPISTITTFGDAIVAFVCWLIIGHRMAANPQSATVQVRCLHNFFKYMCIFMLFMATPSLVLPFAPQQFPLLQAWGYTIGHVFLYIALTYALRMTFSLVPRLAKASWLAILLGTVANIAVSAVTFLTMVQGIHPQYNSADGLIMYNAQPVVGTSIALFAALAVFPAAILMIINGFRNPAARMRSFLLGGGLFLTMAAGPIHDNAKTAAVYAAADILTIVALMVVASGVLYRYNEKMAWSKQSTTRSKPAASR